MIQTSHTKEGVGYWEQMNVPRIHALWFTYQSIDEWRKSNQTGIKKSGIQHQVVMAELKGATEFLTSEGTETGQNSGEKTLPINAFKVPELLTSKEPVTIVKNPDKPNMEIIKKEGIKIESYKITKLERLI